MRATALFPGTMGLCGLAVAVVGAENVIAGHWGGPVYLRSENMPAADLRAAIDLIQEEARKYNVTVTAIESIEPDWISANPSGALSAEANAALMSGLNSAREIVLYAHGAD